MRWDFHTFNTLNTTELFAIMKLRVDVFVVEQACAYPEIDQHDSAADTLHLLGYAGEELAAYARAIPAPLSTDAHSTGEQTPYPPIRIGRVVIHPAFRGKGLASKLLQQLMDRLEQQYPGRDQCLAAQQSVKSLYANLGFEAVSEVYQEDGIAHIDMHRQLTG